MLRAMGVRRLEATRYEAADTREVDAEHWRNATLLSAREANSKSVRDRLRARSRYELANNSYARGMVNTAADDVVGDGPRLQLNTGNREANKIAEQLFAEWADQVDLWGKLRVMEIAHIQDGEVFGILTTNDARPGPVKLDLQLVEADRVTNPSADPSDPYEADGIRYDENYNPVEYQVWSGYPHEATMRIAGDDWRMVPASGVVHYFTPERPGQLRGIPELTPALLLFAQLRRYTLATLGAAEAVADQALVLQTDTPAEEGGVDPDPLDTFQLTANAVTALPDGWKLNQPKAEQPVTGYEEFVRALLREVARCLSMPLNIALADSHEYNYASGRLDHGTYFHRIRIRRGRARLVTLDRIVRAWVAEASLIEGYLPRELRTEPPAWRHTWQWTGREHADPEKEANAARTRMESGVTNLAIECGRVGLDWQDVLEGEAEVRKFMAELGLEVKATTTQGDPQRQQQQEAANA